METNNFDTYFETLSQTYLKILDEKYLSPDKVLQIIKTLNLPSPKAQSIILTTMRDATRQTSLELYGNSNKRRQDVLNAIMGALKKLEKPKPKGETPKKG